MSWRCSHPPRAVPLGPVRPGVFPSGDCGSQPFLLSRGQHPLKRTESPLGGRAVHLVPPGIRAWHRPDRLGGLADEVDVVAGYLVWRGNVIADRGREGARAAEQVRVTGPLSESGDHAGKVSGGADRALRAALNPSGRMSRRVQMPHGWHRITDTGPRPSLTRKRRWESKGKPDADLRQTPQRTPQKALGGNRHPVRRPLRSGRLPGAIARIDGDGERYGSLATIRPGQGLPSGGSTEASSLPPDEIQSFRWS